jgi:hypothetical protein
MLFLSLRFPWSFHILYFCLAVFIDNRISGVHTFNFGGEFQRKQVLHDMPENTSDHHPIRMSIKFKHKNVEVHSKQNDSRIAKKITNKSKLKKKHTTKYQGRNTTFKYTRHDKHLLY